MKLISASALANTKKCCKVILKHTKLDHKETIFWKNKLEYSVEHVSPAEAAAMDTMTETYG